PTFPWPPGWSATGPPPGIPGRAANNGRRLERGGQDQVKRDHRRLVMTPGPTEVEEPVRRALAQPMTNPDVDGDFVRFYEGLVSKVGRAMGTAHRVLILTGA